MSRLNKTTAGKAILAPKLRFPTFLSDPAWHEMPMSEVYSFKGNNSLSREKLNYENGSVRNIHYGDIHTKFPALFDITKQLVPYINPSQPIDGFRPENDCAEGDIVFADASEDLEDIGKSIEIIRLNGERVVSGLHTILARPDKMDLATGFGAQLFKSRRVRAQIQREAQGAKVLGISPTRLAKIKLPLPPTKAEQQKIAECLGLLDELAERERQKLEALKAHKKGLMQQLFPREGETLPRLRFPLFQDEAEWERKATGDLVVSLSPPKKLLTSAYQAEGTFPVIDQSQDFICGWTNDSDAVISGVFPVIVFGDHTCILKFVDRPFAQGADGIKIFRGAAEIDTAFLYYALEANPVAQESYKRHFSALREKVIAFPKESPGEQERIASCLSSLDGLIAAQAEKISALSVHKQGLMQQLFPSLAEPEA